ncbi:MAG: UDP-galactopyranose mutase, partial [Bifidobacteriales bacterium]|nr:UDP-galactopyranose mutase [Bifidobacteriales bacterium]
AVEHSGARVRIIDVRDHIGGNAYSYMDEETGAEIHKYGAHLFHTSNRKVWEYVNRFTEFTDYTHRVYTTHKGEVYPLPINLGTINQFFHAHYTPQQARELIREQAGELAGTDPGNLNDQGISLIGRPLYEAFIKNYTAKQWQTDPSQLPASIIKRLPVRFNYDNHYFKDTWEGLPKDGYTAWFERMIDDPRIQVSLKTDFFDDSQPWNRDALVGQVPVVYTGPVDRYFDYRLGELKWRTVDFKERRYDEDDHFGCPVMNFSDPDVPYTRAIEFKNFNPERYDRQNHERTVVWEEYSRFAGKGDEPYYPINTGDDRALYAQYKQLAAQQPKVVFGGRLGTYAYYDMHQVINSALDAWDKRIAPLVGHTKD